MIIFDIIDNLSCITRWSQAHCTKKESVLEHTAFVAMYSYYLCCKHNIENKEEALIKALVHDIDEIVTGDIPNPTKYHNKRITKEIRMIEEQAAGEISDAVFNGCLFENWVYAKDFNTESGCIVAISDCAAVAYKIWQEINIGNKSFRRYIPNVKRSLDNLHNNVMDKFITDVIELAKMVESI